MEDTSLTLCGEKEQKLEKKFQDELGADMNQSFGLGLGRICGKCRVWASGCGISGTGEAMGMLQPKFECGELLPSPLNKIKGNFGETAIR